MNFHTAQSQILQLGTGSTSFQTLYPGYSYFIDRIEGELGIIAYVDTMSAWVGASNPVVSEANCANFLERFRQAAKAKNKVALILPVSESIAKVVRSKKWYALQVGSEPWYTITKDRAHPNAKQLLNRGAVVEPFDPSTLPVREKMELDELTLSWLRSRKMANLAFLNRVEPWHFHTERRYFRLLYQRQQVAYLAAVPVKSRNSWYFVDIIRDPESPAGTTEALITEGVKYLSKEGASEVTLGMSPFSDVENSELPFHPLTYRAFKYLFHRMEAFYGFKTLFNYKQKFNADRWEPQYLVVLEKRIGIRALFGLGRAVFPKGYVNASLASIFRIADRVNFSAVYDWTLNLNIVPRVAPKKLSDVIIRAKFTFLAMVSWVLFFFSTTDEHFHIRPNMVKRYSYSLTNLFHGDSPTRGIIDLIIASFLHWEPVHLLTNITVAFFMMGFLECAFGTSITAVSYFSGILFSNPLTSLFLYPLLYVFAPGQVSHFFNEPDIGSSLGVFACIGTLCVFVKRPIWLAGIFALATLLYNVETHSFLGLDHLMALLIGYVIGKRYMRVF